MSGPTLYNPVAVRDVEVYLAVPAEQVDSAMTLKGADVQVEPLGKGVILKISVVDDVEWVTVSLK